MDDYMTALKKVIDKSRRSFLKALPAAPLAAPSIAQEVARFGGIPSGAGFIGGTAVNIASQIDPSYLLNERSRLEKLARGEFDDEDEHYMKPRKDMELALHYDGLRSLSPVMRAQFHARKVAYQQREERKFWAGIELKRFLKARFGGLA